MRLRNIKSTTLHDEEEHKIRGDDNVGQRLFDGIKLSPNAAKRNLIKIKFMISLDGFLKIIKNAGRMFKN